MAYDQRGGRRDRGPEWRGDDGFGGGWGNQVPRPHRLGDRNWRGQLDDDGPERGEPYVGGYRGDDYDDRSPGGWQSGGIGTDAEFSGPRFDRADVGSAGSHGVHPVASASAPGYGGAGFGSSAREHAIRRQAERRHHDPHYRDWRARQMAEFDRDYEEYRRENQSRFDSEFSAWRSRRGEQRAAVGRVREQMEVTGADGGHVGTVDCTRGERVILTGSDPEAGGIHHSIPCGWIDRVEDKVVLNIEAEEARRRWQSEGRSRALFEREDLGERGPHVLNRSFAGTDRDED
jgi:hypothetical protein